MSNKTILQANNNKLSANNTDLASILNTINSLPEAGSSGATPHYITFSNPYGQMFSPTKGYPGQELIVVYEAEISMSSVLFLPTYNNFEDTVEHTLLCSFGTSNMTGTNFVYCIYSIVMPDSDIHIDIL